MSGAFEAWSRVRSRVCSATPSIYCERWMGVVHLGPPHSGRPYHWPTSCLALGEERFHCLVKGSMPVLNLLIAEERHRIPDQVFLHLRNSPALAEVQEGIRGCLCGIGRAHRVVMAYGAVPSFF